MGTTEPSPCPTYCLNNPIKYCDPHGKIAIYDDVTVLCIIALAFVVVCELIVLCAYLEYSSSLSFTFPTTTFTTSYQTESYINEAKTKGKENVRDSGLKEVSDEEVLQRSHDKKLPKSERQRYIREEKARGIRNIRKRLSK